MSSSGSSGSSLATSRAGISSSDTSPSATRAQLPTEGVDAAVDVGSAVLDQSVGVEHHGGPGDAAATRFSVNASNPVPERRSGRHPRAKTWPSAVANQWRQVPGVRVRQHPVARGRTPRRHR